MADKKDERLTIQGDTIITRDVNHRPIRVLSLPTKSKASWRDALRRLTNDGQDLYEVLYNLAMGVPHIATLPDGRQTEPTVPTFEVRRAAAVDLIQFLHGKAVAQSEVSKAEADARIAQQVGAMSDGELLKIIEGSYKTLSEGQGEASDGEKEGVSHSGQRGQETPVVPGRRK